MTTNSPIPPTMACSLIDFFERDRSSDFLFSANRCYLYLNPSDGGYDITLRVRSGWLGLRVFHPHLAPRFTLREKWNINKAYKKWLIAIDALIDKRTQRGCFKSAGGPQ